MSETFTINNVYPWGRRFFEYSRMFTLTEEMQGKRILDCGGGPSSFAAEATAKGWDVTAVDPLYQFPGSEIKRRVEETRNEILGTVTDHSDRFSWKTIASPKEMCDLRIEAMEQFLQDYDEGLRSGRYLDASLPALPFDDQQFDLALVSHLLFLNNSLDLQFHVDSLEELTRVAREVRIFPLLNMDGETSDLLLPIWNSCRKRGYSAVLQPVDYQVQKGGAIMLRLSRSPLATE